MSTTDLGNLSGTHNYTGFIDSADLSDWYNFSLNKPGSFSVSLANLSANADVRLLDSNGTVLYSSFLAGTSPEAINADQLAAGDYLLQVLSAGENTNYQLNLTVDPLTGLSVESGFFTVGESGQVGIDFLFDGGSYEGEIAIFSLKGMAAYNAGSPNFIKEAARRALSDSVEGHIVIDDANQGAKLSASLPWEGDFNRDEYQGMKTVAMTPGDEFGIMLVPNGKVQEVFDNPNANGEKRPLFSLATANPLEAFQVGQIADVTGDGRTFVMEDLRIDSGSDKDYNDIVFRVTGASGKAINLNEVINPKRDWRITEFGEQLRVYINMPPQELQFITQPIYTAGDIITLTEAKVYDDNANLSKVEFLLQKDGGEWMKHGEVVELRTDNEGWTNFTYKLTNLDVGNYQLKGLAYDGNGAASNEVIQSFCINKLVEPAPVEPTPIEPMPVEPTPVEPTPIEPMPMEPTPVEPTPIEPMPVEPTPVEPTPIEPMPVEPTPVEPTPVEPMPVEPTPVEATPIEPMPVEPTPVEATPIEPMPVEPTPVEPTPVEPPLNLPPQSLYFDTLPLYTNAETVSFSGAKVYDPDGNNDLKKVDFWLQKLDGERLELSDVTEFITDNNGRSRFNFRYDLNGLAPGNYQLFATAYDYAGNASNTASQSFFVITDLDGSGLSNPVRLAIAEAANLESYNPRALAQTREWVVWVTPGQSPQNLATIIGAQDLGSTGYIPNTYIWQFSDSIAPAEVSEQLKSLNGVEFAYPLVPIQLHPQLVPNDPLFANQWQWENTGQTGGTAGADANITDAWDSVRGSGVTIGIVDGDLDYTHPDLRRNYRADLSRDFNEGNIQTRAYDYDPAPPLSVKFRGDVETPAIDDNSTTFFELETGLNGTVTDVNVTLDITHPSVGDLDVFLVSPSGTRVELFTDLAGGSGLTNTILDEAAATSITAGSAPFSGSYRPEGMLANFNGEDARGVWKLEIADDTAGNIGRINNWSVQFTTSNRHGTAVGGNVAAEGNNGLGVTGAAPEASLAGLRLIANRVTDLQIADALSYRNQDIDIYNNSWKTDSFKDLPISLYAMELAVRQGRNGLGNNYVFAGGNDRSEAQNVNYNPFAKSRSTIAVAALDHNGKFAPYSEPGAPILVSAYSKGDNQYRFISNARQAIPDNRTVSSNLNASGVVGSITDVAVTLNIQHPRTSDLDVFLMSPSGKRIELFTDVGGNGTDFLNTVLTDDASASIAFASAPFNSSFRAEGRLSDFDGENPNGSWRLEITDDTGQQVGQLRSWSLSIGTNGIVTTDLVGTEGKDAGDYTRDFGGTSAAAPVVSGVIALMLEANPNLTWRDVQHILVETARPTDPNDWHDLKDEPNWQTNGAGYAVNHNYGFGAIDAAAAVELAAGWVPVDPEVSVGSDLLLVGEEIPQSVNVFFAEDANWIEQTVNIEEDIKVEWVEVMLDITHEHRGDLMIELISPDGTVSTLAEPSVDENNNYKWVFATPHHWGASSAGEWKLRVADLYSNPSNDLGTWNEWKLNFYGTTDEPVVALRSTDPIASEFGDSGEFTITRTGSTASPLTVNYEMAGRAENGSDYENLIGSVTIPAGADSVKIPLTVFADNVPVEGNETVVLKLLSSIGYQVATSGSSTIIINEPTWVQQLGTVGVDAAFNVAVDREENVYLSGETSGDFGGANAGGSDVLLAKYDKNGVQQWVQQFGTDSSERAESMTVDSSGNIYLTGWTWGSLGGTNSTGGDINGWVAKYDSNGNQLWSQQLGIATFYDVAVDNAGNVYVVGESWNLNSSSPQTDALMLKYDSGGNLLWGRIYDAEDKFDVARSIAVDNSGNIYMSGNTQTGLDRDPLKPTNAGEVNAWAVKYDSNGNELWAQQIDSAGDDRATNIAVDPSGNIYLTGYTNGDLGGTNAGGWDAWIAKYDSIGSKLWIQQFGSVNDDNSWSLAADSFNSIYITGISMGDVGGSNGGSGDAWVAKYSDSGINIWTQKLASKNYDIAWGVAVDEAYNIYISGYTNGNLGGTSVGSVDAWVAKYQTI
ncbi:proprotein convertase P-domain-containing protein [Microcoleus sp. FACHB-68]|uniref:proprotein convertase P-domain-containing protein n=1 Tax=Microcoleus sp. FACHB-68 TaxID=2692826 RepID=UPI0016893522|nr:proprotein convertase P-domain-containing protein [Microcoleus sp. FACHB-68]MBD1938468.1 proprotein convertase P-domain-containing protein [Microcoleus sp. FACHB-68]